MKIHELKIEGFKSIGSITLTEPNPFSVFVGPNASGKSNIFEALEFFELCNIMFFREALKLTGNVEDFITNISTQLESILYFRIDLGDIDPSLQINFKIENNIPYISGSSYGDWVGFFFELNKPVFGNVATRFLENKSYYHLSNFTRLFVREPESKVKRKIQDDSRLSSDASNLEKVLKRILKDENNRSEIIEILQLLIPGFSSVEIRTEELSGSDNLVVYEEALKKPLTKRLISDGTYNILAIIAAVYQSEEPQFLCIEEPENGLNPKVIQLLVSLFREKCKEKGHYIWLNTHSQTLVAELTPEEIILVDKKNGLTQVKQIKGFDLHGLRMDEALLTNTLGGGIPW